MFRLRPLPATITGHEPFYLIATWFQSGRIRPASGSWGSLAAWPACWLVKYCLGLPGIAAFALLATIVGFWSVARYIPHVTQKDPSEIVIDEVIGMALMWLFIPAGSFFWGLVGFVIFRLLDSLKPGPIGWCDRKLTGPSGIIVDDMIAGVTAGLIVWALLFLPSGQELSALAQ